MDVFQTRCLRRILKIFWPRTISSEELYRRTSKTPLSVQIKKRRRRWIGHINRMALNAISRVAMRWTPAGKRKRGRPKLTWRRSVEKCNERGWLDLEPGSTLGIWQAAFFLVGDSLMCYRAQLGLSIVIHPLIALSTLDMVPFRQNSSRTIQSHVLRN